MGPHTTHISAQLTTYSGVPMSPTPTSPGSITHRATHRAQEVALLTLTGLSVLSSGSDGKESACSVGGLSLIPGLGRPPGAGNGNPLQYSSLQNSMNRGAWRDIYKTTESQTVRHDWAANTFTFHHRFVIKAITQEQLVTRERRTRHRS